MLNNVSPMLTMTGIKSWSTPLESHIGDEQQSPGSHAQDVDLAQSTYSRQCGLCCWVKQIFVCLRGVLHMVTNSFRPWIKRKVSRTFLSQFSFAEPQEAQLLNKLLPYCKAKPALELD